MADRKRPRSPNIQNYRPQLTSVLSIANRITGVVLSICAVALVGWLIGVAAGPEVFAEVCAVARSWFGQFLLLIGTFSFFLHLCGGVRHLVWDTVHGFELGTIYASGWTVVGVSIVLTIGAWVASWAMAP